MALTGSTPAIRTKKSVTAALAGTYAHSCIGSEDFDFTAACCADPSLRIKTIPLLKSMHLAMDPTQKIEMFADDDIPGSPKDGSANGGPSNNASDTVLAVLAILVAVVFGLCQWQFPKTRIRLGTFLNLTPIESDIYWKLKMPLQPHGGRQVG
ncbi:hypothetical protein F4680DRAFT_454579 [Xylaria scruposa]|nr:hypothetical protein F4680DRAFT_454579 [Xylaria scruposa]